MEINVQTDTELKGGGGEGDELLGVMGAKSTNDKYAREKLKLTVTMYYKMRTRML